MKGSQSVADAVQVSLGLAMGLDINLGFVSDWRRVFATAYTERVGSLAWLRSGEAIRSVAPPDLIDRWRWQSVATELYAQEQWLALRSLLTAFKAAGVRAKVLKGLPLARALYGQTGARQCCDIDLLVPSDDRELAEEGLRSIGWRRWYGAAPFDEGYKLVGTHTTVFVELHSILPGEALGHCRIEPTEESTEMIDGVPVPVIGGAAVAVYMAGNMAKHGFVPLLCYIDLAEIWKRMHEPFQQEAVRIAKRAGLYGCLSWALLRSSVLVEAAGGDRKALRLLGVGDHERRSVHAFIRLLWLSDSLTDAARVLGAWTWPRPLRYRPSEIASFWAGRVQRPFAGRFLYRRRYDPTPSGAAPRISL